VSFVFFVVHLFSQGHCMSIWRFRGTPHYLDAQGDRLGVSKVLVDRARKNAEIHRVSTLLGQLCERYHRAPKDESGRPRIYPAELAQVSGTLGQCELELAKLHALAAAAQAMIDEAHAAFGQAPPARAYRIRCDYDEALSPADLKPVKIRPDHPRLTKAKQEHEDGVHIT
jgi:hypothetical protein